VLVAYRKPIAFVSNSAILCDDDSIPGVDGIVYI